MEADNSGNTVKFIGNVTLVRKDSCYLFGDSITAYYSDDCKISKIYAEGNPASYRLIAPIRILCMSAKKMEFFPKERTMRLIGDAKIFEGKNKYTGSVIGSTCSELTVL